MRSHAYRRNMVSICLYEPEIPANTGNIIRLCANTGSRLHLIHPLGFSLEEKSVKRSGLDYHSLTEIDHFDDWKSYLQSHSRRMLALSTKGTTLYTDIKYDLNDILVFGPETRGLPENLRNGPDFFRLIKIPMQPNNRSINLSNSVAIVLYEAWRQLYFKGAIF